MGIGDIFNQVIGVLDKVCAVSVFLILLIIAYGVYKVYQQYADRPPSRAQEPWETKIWVSLRDMAELMDMDKAFRIETDQYSERFTRAYTCRGIINFYGWISVILLREKGTFPRTEIIIANPKIVKGIGTDTITLKANGLEPYGIFLTPIPQYNDRKEAEKWDIIAQDWYDLQVKKRITPIFVAKGSQQVLAVLDIDNGTDGVIQRLLNKGEEALLGATKDER